MLLLLLLLLPLAQQPAAAAGSSTCTAADPVSRCLISPLMLPHAHAHHPVQYFTASDPAFQDMAQQWESDGAVRRWEGPVVGTLRDGVFAPDDASSSGAVRYVGSGGMRRLAQYLASQASHDGAAAAAGGLACLWSTCVPCGLNVPASSAVSCRQGVVAQAAKRPPPPPPPPPCIPSPLSPQAWWRCGGLSGCRGRGPRPRAGS